MGASVAKTSNVSEAVSKISNSISQNTYTNSDIINETMQTVLLDNCDITANDLLIKYTARNKIQSKQIVSAIQNSSISNDIAQSAIQSATSDAGITMGIGYSSASNASSQMADVANVVSNQMATVSTEVSDATQTFTCSGSTIHLAGNIDINFNTDSSMIAEQIVTNSQVTDLQNKISQVTKQTASATSGGLASLIIAIALVICALGYFFAKPLSTPGGMIIILIITFVVCCSLMLGLYINESVPFFNKPIDCRQTSDCPSCKCIEMNDTELQYDTTPLRYKYNIYSSLGNKPNLIQIVISKYSTGELITSNNNGYNNAVLKLIEDDMTTQYNKLIEETNINIPKPPPLLTSTNFLIPTQYRKNIIDESDDDDVRQLGICTPNVMSISEGRYLYTAKPNEFVDELIPDSPEEYPHEQPYNKIATLNNISFKTYCQDKSQSKIARLLLCRLLNIDCSMYIDSDEFVINDNKYCPSTEGIKYKPSGSHDFNDGISTHGMIIGKLGVCNTQSYKIQKYNKYFVIVLVVVISVCLIGIIFRRTSKNPDNSFKK